MSVQNNSAGILPVIASVRAESLQPVRLCGPMDCSTSEFPVFHCLPAFAQTHVHSVSNAKQPSHPLLPLSSPALNLSQHQSLSRRWKSLAELTCKKCLA